MRRTNANASSSTSKWRGLRLQFSLRQLLLLTLVSAFILVGWLWLEPTIAFSAGIDSHPAHLGGWQRKSTNRGNEWTSKSGATYTDRNRDGQPDYFEAATFGTTEYWWVDDDFDGIFDRRVECGCFHYQETKVASRVPKPNRPLPYLPITVTILLAVAGAAFLRRPAQGDGTPNSGRGVRRTA